MLDKSNEETNRHAAVYLLIRYSPPVFSRDFLESIKFKIMLFQDYRGNDKI